ncbi:porin family protein [Fluviicola sp.]|uniref:porin family protein n=1 Tax=Fluviicola sp. TaxID=1917219 RepID=UPI002636BBC7|nr:porin family protein [Fluviicola sp.]
MYRFLFLVCFISIESITPILAQSNKYNIGIDAGPNLSIILQEGMKQRNIQPIVLISGGLTFQYNCKKLFSFKTGISYQRKGSLTPSGTFFTIYGNKYQTGRFTSYLDYLTIPFLARFTFGKKVHFFASLGPYFGYLLRDRIEEYKYGKYEYYEPDIEFRYRWDFGFAGGIGVAVPIKKRWLFSLEACNYSGILNTYTNTTDLRLGISYKLGFRSENN